jgi:hypothetical protein
MKVQAMLAEMHSSLDQRLLVKFHAAARNGDLSTFLPENWAGVNGWIAVVF